MRTLQGRKVLFGLFLSLFLIIVPLGGDAWGDQQEVFVGKEVVYTEKVYTLKGYLSKPNGPGPFPAVIYNHGGLGNKIGGSPRETSEALSRAGYVGFSPLRRPTVPMSGHLDDVMDALDYVKGLNYVDKDQIAIMGFSRGGHLAFVTGSIRKDVKAIVIMAAAPGRGGQGQFLTNAAKISSPVLLMVAENDNVGEDHVTLMKRMKTALDKEGKHAEFILYPPYQSDGHRMFFEIGPYWADVLRFLDRTLKKNY
ncbi:MAG: dienelactone hydrolase family protein [Nanoarchaeota archaeon]